MKQLYNLKLFFTILFISFIHQAFAQQHGKIAGSIKTSDGAPAAFVNVGIVELNKVAITSEEGTYTITGVKPGEYTLKSSYVGLKTQEKTITVVAGQTTDADFTLVENQQELSEVVVTATKSQNKKPVTIGKMDVQPMDLPQSMSVVGREIIEDQQASKLSDVIKNVNGVSLGTTRGASTETFFARGYNLGSNNIMRNGTRVNTGVIPEASSLEKVEVLKGSAALLYGMVSGGAVINMVTKQPKFNYGGEVAMRVGSYNFYKPMVDFYGPISKNLAFRVVSTYENTESYRSSVRADKFYINPSLLYKLGSKTEILVQGDFMKNDLKPDFGIGSLDGKIPTTISRSRYFNTPWAYQKVDQTTISANINHKINEAWRVNAIGSYSAFNRNYFSTERIQANALGDWARKLTKTLTSEDYYTGQLNLNGTVHTGKIKHNILIGADAERYNNISHTFKIPADAYDTINVLDPNKFVARTDKPDLSAISRTETPTYRYGLYTQDLISLSEKIKILAGLRWSFQQIAEAKVYDLIANTETKTSSANTKIDRAISPRLGVVYQPISSTSVFVSYSNNFIPNTGKDVYEQNLKPSIVDQFEIGVKNDLIKGRLSANVTYYKIINNDLAIQAQFDKDGVENTNNQVKEFSGETTSDGLEIDIAGNIIPGLNFMAGYSYNFMRYTKTKGGKGSYYVGERLVSNPAHTGNATIFYTLSKTKLKGLKIGASGFYTGERNAGWNNTVGQAQQYNRLIPVSGFFTFDLSLGYSIKKVSLLAKVSNITNELNYYVHENYSVNPIPPREFLTTIAYRF